VAVKTVGFAAADDDRPLLDRLVEKYGHGNRSEFLRTAMKIMAAEERAERLRSIQDAVHSQVGQPSPPVPRLLDGHRQRGRRGRLSGSACAARYDVADRGVTMSVN
jgi:Arc/MetJ-type ribon-helix-helix transcriptional regulator